MQRIAMNTKGLSLFWSFKFILVSIDAFTRHIQLFPATVSSIAAVNALQYIYMWRTMAPLCCQFCIPVQILTEPGTRFLDQTQKHLATISGISHHTSIPYSKEKKMVLWKGLTKWSTETSVTYFRIRLVSKSGHRCFV